MADDDSPPVGPHGSMQENIQHDDVQDTGVPNLCDLVGVLKVTVSAVRNIPLVPVPPPEQSVAIDSSPQPGRGRRVPLWVQGSPFLKLQMGLHQFQTMEPTLAVHKDEVNEGDLPDLEWGETLEFELSGDMRELRIFLMNWELPFADGPQGVLRIPVGQLVNMKWAKVSRALTYYFKTKNDEQLKHSDDQFTNIVIIVEYGPGSSMKLGGGSSMAPARVLQSGYMITCDLCRRWVFVTARPTPSLARGSRRAKSQRKIHLWLRDYNFHAALAGVSKFEVPRSQLALPAFVYGPEAAFSSTIRDFVTVILQDKVLKEKLKAMKQLNHNRKLNTWTPIYCSSDGDGGGLEEAVSVAVWGTQDVASRIAMEIQSEFQENHDKYLHLWKKAHFDWFPAHGENECKRTWEKISDEIKEGKSFSHETTLVRLLVLTHVFKRPLVVHSDEPSFRHDASIRHSDAPKSHVRTEDKFGGIPVFQQAQTSGSALVREEAEELSTRQLSRPHPSQIRGIYLPMMHPKPLLLESNRAKSYRPPVPLVYSTESQSFLPLVAQEEEETDLFEILPWPPLMPLFSEHHLLPLPFTLINTTTEEGQATGEIFMHKFIMCHNTDKSRALVSSYGVPRNSKLTTSEKVRCVALAPLDTSQFLPTFYPVLKRYLLLVDHYHWTSELHEAEDMSGIEMADFVAGQRPWNKLPRKEEVEAALETYARGKYLQSPLASGQDWTSSTHTRGLRTEHKQLRDLFHDCIRLASCVKLEDIDDALKVVQTREKDALEDRKRKETRDKEAEKNK
jgi:hypothetical protein